MIDSRKILRRERRCPEKCCGTFGEKQSGARVNETVSIYTAGKSRECVAKDVRGDGLRASLCELTTEREHEGGDGKERKKNLRRKKKNVLVHEKN